MLTAQHLYQLPLELRIYVANMDMETYVQMYVYDNEFKVYASSINVIDIFIDRFVVRKESNHTIYKFNNIECRKYQDKWNTRCETWYKDDKIHNSHGPAHLSNDGTITYYIDGLTHRLDGPAVMYQDGGEEYYVNGKRHRLDGPAVTHSDGFIAYFVDGSLHRLDGPAIIHPDGTEQYCQYGRTVY